MAATAVRSLCRFRACNLLNFTQVFCRKYSSIPHTCKLLPVPFNILTNKYKFYSAEATEAKKKKKTEPKPRITLIGTDEKLQVLLLEEAEKIAKRRDMQLKKISEPDSKSERAVYRLVQLHRASSKSTTKKDEKLVTLSSKIDLHDVESRIKQINKWLAKNIEVRVTITAINGDEARAENVSQAIEKAVASTGRVLQKRMKDKNIKYSIVALNPKTS